MGSGATIAVASRRSRVLESLRTEFGEEVGGVELYRKACAVQDAAATPILALVMAFLPPLITIPLIEQSVWWLILTVSIYVFSLLLMVAVSLKYVRGRVSSFDAMIEREGMQDQLARIHQLDPSLSSR